MYGPALAHQAAVLVAICLSVLAVRLAGRAGAVGARLRRRFVLGLPWGTLVSVAFVLAVYLVVQGGWSHWYTPVTLPFRAWSYLYPLGMLTAGFSHAGPNHLLGNLFGTLALAPVAEYAWGHFPRERGASSFGSWRTNPLVRAFVLFPLAVVGLGVFTALFTLGPVIGFSGVVFAFGGFALVRYPLGTVVALTAMRLPDLVYAALNRPVITAGGRPAYITPWWAQIAIQGHALGLLGGLLVGLAWTQYRDRETPSVSRVFAGALLFALSQGLWAVYWYRGGDTYVLFRAVGVALVFALATVVAVSVAAGDEPLLDRLAAGLDRVTGLVPRAPATDLAGWLRASSPNPGGLTGALRSASARQAGLLALVIVTGLLAGPAIAVNAVTVSDQPLPGDPIEVRDYQVTYAEGVPNGMVGVFDVSAFGASTNVTTSGVLVRNPDRHIWATAVPKGRLAFAGRVETVVGGVGWRATVVATRVGWSAVGGGTAYRVSLGRPDSIEPVFTSPPATADPVLAGRNVSVEAGRRAFYLNVTHGNESARAPLPAVNESVTLLNVTFVHEMAGNDHHRIVATTAEGTRITVATKERYREVEE